MSSDAKTRTCKECKVAKPATPEFFHRNGEYLLTICKECNNKKRRRTTDRKPSFHPPKTHKDFTITPKAVDRFWSYVVKEDNEEDCWAWSGRLHSKGYPDICLDGKKRLAHRVAFQLVNGPIGDEQMVWQTCRNQLCCNPHHLILENKGALARVATVGTRYGHLVFLRPIDQRSKRGDFLWEALCDCGNTTIILPSDAKKGETTSCGCRKGRRWDPMISSARHAWQRYKDGCDFETFFRLSQLPCFYCGRQPYKICNPARGICGEERYINLEYQLNEGNFVYNGLDRLDSSKGHEPTNVVPCCHTCNKAKLSKTVEEFADIITRIHLRTIDGSRSQCYIEVVQPTLDSMSRFGRKYHPIISSARNIWTGRYKDGCDFDTFYFLSQQVCYYCGCRPFATYTGYCGNPFVYNGMDRLDSSKDHSPENVVPCCITCNRTKWELPVSDFLDLVERIYAYWIINQGGQSLLLGQEAHCPVGRMTEN